jgi:hypothetical protein
MRFLTIYSSVEQNRPPTQEEMDTMGAFIKEAIDAGVLISTEGCLPTSLGARVRLEDGKTTVTDGPFSEAKEVVGGFAIMELPSKAEAIEWTERFLRVAGPGVTEIRQLYEVPAYDKG